MFPNTHPAARPPAAPPGRARCQGAAGTVLCPRSLVLPRAPALESPNSSALARELTGPCSPPTEFQSPLPQRRWRGSAAAAPALARVPAEPHAAGQEGRGTRILGSQVCGRQGNPDPWNVSSQPATLRLPQLRQRRCPSPPRTRARNSPTDTHSPEHPQPLATGVPRHKPRRALCQLSTALQRPWPPVPQARGHGASVAAPALTHPALAAGRCPAGRARRRRGGPWGTRCRRCRALAVGSGS